MATLTVSLNKPRQIHLVLQAERKRIEAEAKGIVNRYSLLIQREIIRSMVSGKKTGRIYVIGGALHQASAAGEAPAVITGKLVRSIKRTSVDAGWKSHIGSRLNYAAYLEDGTKHMEKRPAFEPALDKHRAGFIGAMKRMINGA